MPAELMEVKQPTFPSLPDFERVIDQVVSPGAYRFAFVEMFFDEMLARRANCNMDGAIHEVALMAARSFGEAYEANVRIDAGHGPLLPVSFENVALFVSKLSFNDPKMKDVIDEALKRRLIEIAERIGSRNIELAEIFELVEQKSSFALANAWLDYIEDLKRTDLYKSVFIHRRELSILVRCYTLLVAQVVTNKAR